MAVVVDSVAVVFVAIVAILEIVGVEATAVDFAKLRLKKFHEGFENCGDSS